MLGKKLIIQIQSLQPKEKKKLKKWMRSSIHNTDKNLMVLCDFLCSHVSDAATQNIAKEELWNALYPFKPIKEGVLRVKLRQLTKQLEDFVVWEQLHADKRVYNRLLLRAQAKTLPFKEYENEVQKQVKKWINQTTKDVDYFYHQAVLGYQLFSHPQFNHYRTDGELLAKTDHDLSAFFLLMKFRLANEFKNRERILGETNSIYFKEIFSIKEDGFLENNDIAQLYELLFNLIEHPTDEALFATFKQRFNAKRQYLPIIDLKNIYFSILNHLSRQINQGGSHFYKETLSWYQLGLEDGLLLTNGKMSDITFNNIALLGYQSQAFGWTHKFVTEYSQFLKNEVREDAVKICLGTGYFYEKKYTKAITILSQHRFIKAYQLRVRLTIIRALFEQLLLKEDVFDLLDKATIAFDSFMRRNKTFAKTTLKPYQNHLRLLRDLTLRHLIRENKQQTKAWLESELQKDSRVIAKQWLLEKIGVNHPPINSSIT